MTILCIETSTSACSAAICKDGLPNKQCIHLENANHARMLPLFIEELCAYVRESGLHLDAVALSEGPGSYTGLRIGTSTAKGLCYGWNIPLIPVPTLQVLCGAAQAVLTAQEKSMESVQLVPMMDARRMEVYTLNETGEACAVVVESEKSVMNTDQTTYYFGDGAEKCKAVFTQPNWHYIPDIVPQAQYMGAIAEQSAVRLTGTDLAYYEPFYLKDFVPAPSHVKGLV